MSSKINRVGRLTGDPELRYTPQGKAVASFTIVTSSSRFNRQTNAWEDDNVTFWSCEVWEGLAEYLAENFKKGYGIWIEGETRTDKFTDSQGNNRTALKVRVSDFGESVRLNGKRLNVRLSNQSQSNAQGGGFQSPQQSQPQQNQSQQSQPWSAPQADPWANSGGGDGYSSGNSEPPF